MIGDGPTPEALNSSQQNDPYPCSVLRAAADPVAALLRSSRLRVTAVRVAVLELLSNSPAALDAQDVLAALGRRFDRVTIYRTLTSLVDAGIAHRIDPGDRRFRFSITSHHRCTEEHHAHDHPHLLCDACGKVECMDDAEVIIRTINSSDGSRAAKPAPKASGPSGPAAGTSAWRVKQQSVTVHGTCGQCASREPASRRRHRR